MKWLGAALVLLASSGVSAAERDYVTLGGEIRPRYEYIENFAFTSTDNDKNGAVFMRSRIHADFDISDRLFARIELQDVRRWGELAANASATTDNADITLREGYIEMLGLASDRLDFKLGRQAIIRGDERVFGDLDWHRVGRTHDAGIATARFGEQKFDALFIAITENDNIGTTAATKTGSDADAALFGLYGTLHLKPFTRFQPYWIYQDYDSATLAALGLRGNNDFRMHTLGGLISGEVSRWTWDLEGNYQAGDIGDSSANSWMAHAGLAFDLRRKHLAKISAGYDFYSGDSAHGDGEDETYHQIFPSYYDHIGLLGRIGMQNLARLRLAIGGAFLGSSTWRFDWHRFDRARTSDHVYANNGAVLFNQSAMSTKHVGDEFDLIFSWPWTAHATFTVSGSYFSAGNAIKEAVRASGGTPRDAMNVVSQVEVKF